VTVANDEIYEKYLQKAITESNALGDELAQAAGGARIPVLGSGHPLADVFLLKYAPQASELQEGVAFYGRAGNALLKSLQRLHVDPMAIYGTNCLKFAGGDEEESLPFLLRELHIVQPKLVVAMGEPARAFLNTARFPLARELEPVDGELQEYTPTMLGLVLLALPLWSRVWIVAASGLVLGVAAAGFWEAGWHLPSNFAKLAAYTCAGWVFLRFFEELSWVLVVALIIPFVDAISVAA